MPKEILSKDQIKEIAMAMSSDEADLPEREARLMARNLNFQLECETADSINSVTIDVNHGLGKRLRSLLRQVVADAAGDEPVVIFAGELVAIGCARRVDCSVGVAFHGDGRHGDGR